MCILPNDNLGLVRDAMATLKELCLVWNSLQMPDPDKILVEVAPADG